MKTEWSAGQIERLAAVRARRDKRRSVALDVVTLLIIAAFVAGAGIVEAVATL